MKAIPKYFQVTLFGVDERRIIYSNACSCHTIPVFPSTFADDSLTFRLPTLVIQSYLVPQICSDRSLLCQEINEPSCVFNCMQVGLKTFRVWGIIMWKVVNLENCTAEGGNKLTISEHTGSKAWEREIVVFWGAGILGSLEFSSDKDECFFFLRSWGANNPRKTSTLP